MKLGWNGKEPRKEFMEETENENVESYENLLSRNQIISRKNTGNFFLKIPGRDLNRRPSQPY